MGDLDAKKSSISSRESFFTFVMMTFSLKKFPYVLHSSIIELKISFRSASMGNRKIKDVYKRQVVGIRCCADQIKMDKGTTPSFRVGISRNEREGFGDVVSDSSVL